MISQKYHNFINEFLQFHIDRRFCMYVCCACEVWLFHVSLASYILSRMNFEGLHYLNQDTLLIPKVSMKAVNSGVYPTTSPLALTNPHFRHPIAKNSKHNLNRGMFF
jgi:hypothetical protein